MLWFHARYNNAVGQICLSYYMYEDICICKIRYDIY